MADLLVTVTHDNLSSWSGDSAQNSFAFKVGVAVDASVLLDIKNAVSSFYNGITGAQAATLSAYMAPFLDRSAGASKVRVYDITGLLGIDPVTGRPFPHGSPIDEDSLTLSASLGSALPGQVALVLTLRGRDALAQPIEGPGDIRPRARRSGRLYLGPLNRATLDEPGGQGRPLSAFRDDMLLAAEGLQDALVDGDYAWSVWSRTAAALYPIERAEVDNSYDVIRSRKADTTARSTVTFLPEPALVLGA